MTRPTVAIGMFDGVHLGHRALISDARSLAAARGADLDVLTFDPHPREVLTGTGPGLLCSVEERIALLRTAGVRHVHVQPFTREFAALAPEAFVTDVLGRELDAGQVVVGTNFRFGAKAAGDVGLLRAVGATLDMEVVAHELVTDHAEVVSSSRVRALVRTGEVDAAGELLDRPYALAGTVVHGAQRGRELGMRTANLSLDPARLVPADGVYGGIAEVDAGTFGTRHVAAISVGTNPQFDPGGTHPRTVEAHLLDVEAGDILYDLPIRLEFHCRIRGQATFPDLDALVQRMNADVAEVRTLVTA